MRQYFVNHDGAVGVRDCDLRASGRPTHHLALSPGVWITLTKRRALEHQRMTTAVGGGWPGCIRSVMSFAEHCPLAVLQANGSGLIRQPVRIRSEDGREIVCGLNVLRD